MEYYRLINSIRRCNERKDFIKMNEELNKNKEYKNLTTSEKICIKLELYERFKQKNYKDSKNFSYLICTKDIQR